MRTYSATKTLPLAAAVSLGALIFVLGNRTGTADAAPTHPAKRTAPVNAAPTTQPGFNDNTPLTQDQKILHLLNRTTFGPRPGDVAYVRQLGLSAYLDEQLHPERIDDSSIDAKLAGFDALQKSDAELAQDWYQRSENIRKVQQLQRSLQQAQPATPPTMTGATDTMTMAPNGTTGTAPGTTAAPGIPGGPNGRPGVQELAAMTPDQRAQLQETRKAVNKVRDDGVQLVLAKTVRAVESKRQLQEVMTDFWTNHFNIDIRKNACGVYKVSDDRDVVRKYALGRFRDLLEASAKSPAMLVYLDNFQSAGPPQQPAFGRGLFAPGGFRRAQPFRGVQTQPQRPQQPKRAAQGLNENYGREIMELHTLGVDGGYTQKDVTEVARCLTGWTINRQTGQFEFNPRRHDDGEKVVLGHTIEAGGGMQDGEMVLDILASNAATMRHISYQLCQRFVSDQPPAALVDACVATWKRTSGDIREIVRTILTSPEFNSRVAYQQKIKSPFEYAVSAARALGATYTVPEIGDQRPRMLAEEGLARKKTASFNGGGNPRFLPGQVAMMGEPLFQCQPPTGYPEDSRKWVSTGALVQRINFALFLTSGKLSDIDLTGSLDRVYGTSNQTAAMNAPMSPTQFVNRLTNVLLHGEVSPATRATLLHEATNMASGASGTPETASAAPNAAFPPTAAGIPDPEMSRKLVALVLGSPEFQRR